MLGRQPILQRQCLGLRRTADPRDHGAMRIDRAHHIAAAVQIENHAVPGCARCDDPFCRHAARREGLAGNVLGDSFCNLFHRGAHLTDGRVGLGRGHRSDYLEHFVELFTRHA